MTGGHDDEPTGIWARSTAPQSDYGMGAVWRGIAVLIVGFLLTFGIALALA